MTVKEYRGWQDYYVLEPFGPQDTYSMLAQISAVIYNMNRSPKSKPLNISDFNVNLSKEDRDLREERESRQWRKSLLQSVRRHNASVEGNDDGSG